jgi:hypothetical protein
MPPGQTDLTAASLRTTELFALGRIVTRFGPVTHAGDLRRSEHLKLSHPTIIPHWDAARLIRSCHSFKWLRRDRGGTFAVARNE